ncbi:MAG: 4a-hydroxytetrahydrobiopterin dehydratase [Euryarchaeota archaeon RBG_16_68_13]|nr:MAG: 4a-hydroxytetrahydrobiopterin dehydratase [Euryarchaeota archaeon RBG_16_68_13]
MARELLSEGEIVHRLAEVPRWSRRESAIERTWRFKDFPEALSFVNRVGALAEAADHHPDIANSWNRVTLSLTTHDAGGLTRRDFDLAKEIDALGL